jgi:hypothetical protein
MYEWWFKMMKKSVKRISNHLLVSQKGLHYETFEHELCKLPILCHAVVNTLSDKLSIPLIFENVNGNEKRSHIPKDPDMEQRETADKTFGNVFLDCWHQNLQQSTIKSEKSYE